MSYVMKIKSSGRDSVQGFLPWNRMDAQQTGLCKTSCMTCETDVDLMVSFANTYLQPQSHLLLDMAAMEEIMSHAVSSPWNNNKSYVLGRTIRQEVP